MASTTTRRVGIDLERLKDGTAPYYAKRGRYYAGRMKPTRTMRWYVEEEYFEEVVRLSRIEDGQIALDVNTGNPICGATAIYLKRAAPGARVIAIDKAKKLVAGAAENAEKAGVPGIEFRQAYEEDLSEFADGTFDVIVDRLGFHHNRQPTVALSEMHRTLKPTGRLILADILAPADESAQNWLNRIWSRHDPGHVKWYRQDEIDAFLDRAGFVREEQVPWRLPMHMDEIGWFSPKDRERTQAALARATPAVREIYAMTGEGDDMTIVLDMMITAYVKGQATP